MPPITTQHLTLVLESVDDARAKVDAMSPDDKAHLSDEWLAILAAATHADPWILGFRMLRRDDGTCVGQCGYKGPPNSDGVVEIAYFVEPDYQGNGYATEAAEALTKYAFQTNEVELVCAHTLPERNASTRVLTKAGFQNVGEVVDPDDGLVWRWTRHRETA